MNAQSVLNEISQSDEEWRRERDYIDAVNTELSVPTGADHPCSAGYQLYYFCFGNAGSR